MGRLLGSPKTSVATKTPGPRPGRTRWTHPSDHRHRLRAPLARGESAGSRLPHRPPSRSQLHRLEVGQSSTSFPPSEVIGNGHLPPVPVNCLSRQTSCRHAFPPGRLRVVMETQDLCASATLMAAAFGGAGGRRRRLRKSLRDRVCFKS